MGNKPEKISSKYEIGKKLGTGSFAIVRLVTEKKTGRQHAVKIIKKKNLDKEELENIHDEVNILERVNHPNIVKLIEIFENKKYLYIVLELLAGGELFDRIVSRGSFTESDASDVVRQMTEALKYMNDMGVVHRDLKPENLIYGEVDGDLVKITDFGLAKMTKSGSLYTPCGTPGYVAPEILENKPYGPAVDMWSVGVIAYILLCGFPPFYHENASGLYEQIKKGDYSFPSPYWDTVSDMAKEVVSRLLTVDPGERMTPDELLEHPWVTGDAPTTELGDGFNKKLRVFNARRKFRKAITMVLAVNRLARSVGIFELDEEDEEKED